MVGGKGRTLAGEHWFAGLEWVPEEEPGLLRPSGVIGTGVGMLRGRGILKAKAAGCLSQLAVLRAAAGQLGSVETPMSAQDPCLPLLCRTPPARDSNAFLAQQPLTLLQYIFFQPQCRYMRGLPVP